MKILTPWLRSYLPVLNVDDAQLADDLTLRGVAVEGVFELNDAAGESDGAMFDMDITTNRVDAMNHYGISREIAAIYDLKLHALDTKLPEAAAGEGYPVRIEAPERCGRFTARVIRGVKIGATEGKLARWFGELGQKRILNAVDATNAVLLGMGHPTHAFDLDKVQGAIVVRMARAGEQIKLLDGTTRTLVADDLVVADEVKALGLAGVMGGWDSMITAETRNVLVEAAWFEPAGIRASSRRHLIHTDASHRFERGADFAAAPVANALVCKAVLEACGGQLVGPLVDVVVDAHEAATVGRAAVTLSVREVRRQLGTTTDPAGITAELVEQYLTALGCGLAVAGEGEYHVTLPSWRLDLTREIDLIEEIARVYGYNRFANTLPTPGTVVAHAAGEQEALVRRRLLAMGFSETLSSTFASAAESAEFAPAVRAVAMENPLSEEAANLRPSLLPGMVTMLAHNLNRDVTAARLFEVGAVFAGEAEAVEERVSLALGITGSTVESKLYSAEDAAFFELKGALEGLGGLFEGAAISYAADGLPGWLEAGRGAAVLVGGQRVGALGQLTAAESARRKLRQAIWVAELDLAVLLALPMRRVVAKEVSRYQAVDRDFSFIFPDAVVYGQIAEAIRGLAIAELQSLRPVELWRDEKKFAGVYATSVRATFQSADRTLTEADLTGWWAAIIGVMEGLGGTIRS